MAVADALARLQAITAGAQRRDPRQQAIERLQAILAARSGGRHGMGAGNLEPGAEGYQQGQPGYGARFGQPPVPGRDLGGRFGGRLAALNAEHVLPNLRLALLGSQGQQGRGFTGARTVRGVDPTGLAIGITGAKIPVNAVNRRTGTTRRKGGY